MDREQVILDQRRTASLPECGVKELDGWVDEALEQAAAARKKKDRKQAAHELNHAAALMARSAALLRGDI